MREVAVLAALVLAAGCGGGGTERGRRAARGPFTVESIDVAGETGVLLDRSIEIRLSDGVDEASVGPASVRIRTVDGLTARGMLTRGALLRDPETGAPVTVDEDMLSPRLLDHIERTGRLDLVPPESRLDRGAWVEGSGARRVLVDRSKKQRITFFPEVPTLPDLSDGGLLPGRTYVVSLPVAPETGPLRSLGGAALVAGPNGAPTASFTTVDAGAAAVFSGADSPGAPRVVHVEPEERATGVWIDARVTIRFSEPLDPRSLLAEDFVLRLASLSGRPQIPTSLFLRQYRLGVVEVVMTPLADLPLYQLYELTLGEGPSDLAGVPLEPFRAMFSTGYDVPYWGLSLWEPFESDAMADETVTTADWGGAVPGALVATVTETSRESFARSRWYDQFYESVTYRDAEVDADANGGEIEIEVQGASEDWTRPGSQPVDPDADPDRLFTTDWIPVAEAPRLSPHEYVRFRVRFRVPEDHVDGDPLPLVREIRIPADVDPK